MKLNVDERPSKLASACALAPISVEAHVTVVGLSAVWATPVSVRQQHIQTRRTVDSRLGYAGINGFAIENPGMAKPLATTGALVSGVPPRERPV